MLTFPYLVCDLWHFRTPLCYSVLIPEVMIYGPFQHYFPLCHSIVAWLLVLMETVKTPRKILFMRKPTPWCKHSHTHNPGGRPSFSFQSSCALAPSEYWVWSGWGTRHFLRSIGLSLRLLASLGNSSPGATSCPKNPKAAHCWVTPMALPQGLEMNKRY